MRKQALIKQVSAELFEENREAFKKTYDEQEELPRNIRNLISGYLSRVRKR